MYRVYKNLHKDDFTVQEYKKSIGWRKKLGSEFLYCTGVTFKVYSAGRERVLRERAKNVHAYLCCEKYEVIDQEIILDGYSRLSYDPYKSEEFTIDGESVHELEFVYLTPEGCFTLT